MRIAVAGQIADNHCPGGDADAKLWEAGRRPSQGACRLDQREPREDGPCRGVLVRFRITEIDQCAVAHVLGDRTAKRSHRFRADRPKIGDDTTQIFRVQLRRQCRGTDEVTEHHCEVPPLGRGLNGDWRRGRFRWRGRDANQPGAAVGAELRMRRISESARGAGKRDRPAALDAEFTARGKLGLTVEAFHAAPGAFEGGQSTTT